MAIMPQTLMDTGLQNGAPQVLTFGWLASCCLKLFKSFAGEHYAA